MDSWADFPKCPQIVKKRDWELTSRADVFFAGTKEIYDARKRMNNNSCLFTSGVETDHYSPELIHEKPVELSEVKGPVLGYIGLVDDERVDFELLGKMADAHPEWNIVMVGPLQNVSSKTIERNNNIMYLGLKSYDELPAYVSSFDICLVPYKYNAATKKINPTKLMEYMAAGKPIICTAAMQDVNALYIKRVCIAKENSEFIDKAEKIINGEIELPLEDNCKYASEYSWDSIADKMKSAIKMTGDCTKSKH